MLNGGIKMDIVDQSGAKQEYVAYEIGHEVSNNANEKRRSANYKPNIWDFDFLQSLTVPYDREEFDTRCEKLVNKVKDVFSEEMGVSSKLELVDWIQKLGLAIHFEKEIEEALQTIHSVNESNNNPTSEESLYKTAMCFRLLRQHGHQVSPPDILSNFFEEKGIRKVISFTENVKGFIELLEASHLALEGEKIMDDGHEAETFALNFLEDASTNIHSDLEQVIHAMELPSHWRVQWFNVKWHIIHYEKENHLIPDVLELAKLSYNIVQAKLQTEVKELSRWWNNLGLKNHLNFARDRLVECFMCAVGVAAEPKYRSLRKWLTKVINFVLVIDDVYDIYASFEELKQFTIAIDRWDAKEVQQLPDCMKICFQALYDVTNEIATEIEVEKNFEKALPYLKKAWADFCKALYVEAKWHKECYTPSLQEYLSNAWISSSGPMILLHAYFATMHDVTDEVEGFLQTNKEFMYNISLIIRLCNDLETTMAERERGDTASSILCYMNEMGVSEEVARSHIKKLIKKTWMKINGQCFTKVASKQSFVTLATNAARVAHALYQNGDGFGIQDRDIRQQILSLVIEPFLEV